MLSDLAKSALSYLRNQYEMDPDSPSMDLADLAEGDGSGVMSGFLHDLHEKTRRNQISSKRGPSPLHPNSRCEYDPLRNTTIRSPSSAFIVMDGA